MQDHVRNPQRAGADPGQPTQGEREEHDLTHFPLMPWCKACVRGIAKDAPSRQAKALASVVKARFDGRRKLRSYCNATRIARRALTQEAPWDA